MGTCNLSQADWLIGLATLRSDSGWQLCSFHQSTLQLELPTRFIYQLLWVRWSPTDLNTVFFFTRLNFMFSSTVIQFIFGWILFMLTFIFHRGGKLLAFIIILAFENQVIVNLYNTPYYFERFYNAELLTHRWTLILCIIVRLFHCKYWAKPFQIEGYRVSQGKAEA